MKYFMLFLFVKIFAFANTEPKPKTVYLDCYIPGEFPADCQPLRVDFESNEKFEAVSKFDEADIAVEIRIINEGQFTNLITTLRKPGIRDIIFIDPYINSLNSVEAFGRVKENLENQIWFAIGNKKIVNIDDSITFVRESLQPTINSEKKYWLQPRINANLNRGQGTNSFGYRPSMYGTYATKKIKLTGGFNYNYAKDQSQTTAFLPGSTSTSKILGTEVLLARTIKGGWSAAVVGRAKKVNSEFSYADKTLNDNLSSFARKNDAQLLSMKAGLEWVLHPYQESDKGNIAVQYTVGPEWHKYIDPETFEPVTQVPLMNSLRLKLSKHFENIDVSGGFEAFADLIKRQYKGLGVELDASYRVTSRIRLNSYVNVASIQNWIPSAASTGTSFQTLTNGNRDALLFYGNVGLSFTIGNASLPNKDNRWD